MLVDTTKLKTPKNYAEKIKRHLSRIYQMINEGKVETVDIDGVTFIRDNLPEPKETKTEKE